MENPEDEVDINLKVEWNIIKYLQLFTPESDFWKITQGESENCN